MTRNSSDAKIRNGNNQPNEARLFFAIQPAGKIRTILGDMAQKLAEQSGGRHIRPENIHLTLLFLGRTPKEKIPGLVSAASDISAEPFDLIIQKTRFWKRSRIIFAAAETYPPALFTLANAIRTTTRNAGFESDDRAYKPHMTLVRKATQHKPADFDKPIAWQVTHWLLMQSEQNKLGVRYKTLHQWRLG
ncbi:RNA 2',3'-cyclic phosphodiesterase [Nitrosomonas marina]|nr:RNA 2',3'-cyclic phosphodiesterase [Nitrosomonas marina]